MINLTLDPSPIVFIVLYILVIIPYSVWLIKNKRKAYSNIEILERLAFVLYCIFLFKFSMMPIQFLKQDLSRYSSLYYQIVPFKTISTMISDNNWQVQVLGNIAMLFPLPIFLGCFKNGNYKLLSAIKTTFFVSLSIEITQLLIDILARVPTKVADVDDLILNVFGGILGWLVLYVLRRLKFMSFLFKDTEKQGDGSSKHTK